MTEGIILAYIVIALSSLVIGVLIGQLSVFRMLKRKVRNCEMLELSGKHYWIEEESEE